MKTYATYEAAERRAQSIITNLGVWPGIKTIRVPDEPDRYALTIDPSTAQGRYEWIEDNRD